MLLPFTLLSAPAVPPMLVSAFSAACTSAAVALNARSADFAPFSEMVNVPLVPSTCTLWMSGPVRLPS